MFHARKRNIEVHYQYIHEQIVAGSIDLQLTSLDLQTTNIFTKMHGGNKLRQLLTTLGMRWRDMPSLKGSKENDGNEEVEGLGQRAK